MVGLAGSAHAQTSDSPSASKDNGPIEVRDITKLMGIDQKLGQFVPKDAMFKDETGQAVRFDHYLGSLPILIVPVYYNCRSGCPVLVDNLVKTLARAGHPTGMMGATNKGKEQRILELGRDLQVVMLSIDPQEGPAVASERKGSLITLLTQPNVAPNWHFLTGDLENIHKMTDALGFRYIYDARDHLIQHPLGSVILSPNGQISSYIIGNDVPSRVLDSGLLLAAQNKVGLKADQSSMVGCIVPDPATSRRREQIEGYLRLLCLFTLVVMTTWILRLAYTTRQRPSGRGGQPAGV